VVCILEFQSFESCLVAEFPCYIFSDHPLLFFSLPSLHVILNFNLVLSIPLSKKNEKKTPPIPPLIASIPTSQSAPSFQLLFYSYMLNSFCDKKTKGSEEKIRK